MSSRVLRKLHGDKDIGLGIPGASSAKDGDSDGCAESPVTFTGGTKKKANINPFDLVCVPLSTSSPTFTIRWHLLFCKKVI